MKTLLIITLSFFSLQLGATELTPFPGLLQTQDQIQEATFETNTDFITATAGFVSVDFTLSRSLTQDELNEVNELTSENSDRIQITFDNLNVKVSLKADLSNTGVWLKIFSCIGVDEYSFGTATDQIKQPFDVFSNHFNL